MAQMSPKKPVKTAPKTSFLRSKKLKYTFYGVVAWGAANYYVPEIGDTLSEKFNDYTERYAAFDMDNPNPWLENTATKDGDIYNRNAIRVLGEDAESDFFANVDIADKWYAALGRYEMLMEDTDNRIFMKQWLQSLNHLRGKSIEEKATAVDALVDQLVTYEYDSVLYGKNDYFASPLETLWHKKGDCDDFAILKYFALKYLGVPDEHLFVVAVGDKNDELLDHATLLVDIKENSLGSSLVNAIVPDFLNGLFGLDKETEFRVLDNDGSTIGRLIEEDKSQYTPYYAMNSQNFWKVPKNSGLWK